jgi:hypothetical protein
MDIQIYKVEQPDGYYAEEACLAYMEPEYDFTPRELCPKCGKTLNSGYWLRPRHIVLTNRRIPDFLYVWGTSVDFLLSERALEVIREAGLTGIKNVEPIDSARFLRKAKKEVAIPQYYHFEVERSMIQLDREHSRIKYGSTVHEDWICPLCDPVGRTKDFLYGVNFHMDAYEGYDIFHTIENFDSLFVSKRFVDVCREAGLTNLHVCPVQGWGKDGSDFLGINFD